MRFRERVDGFLQGTGPLAEDTVEDATIEVPVHQLTAEQAAQATLRAVLELQEILRGNDNAAALKAEIDRATAHINANTDRLRHLAAELNKEGS